MIKSFQNKYEFLSNFFMIPDATLTVALGNGRSVEVPTSEHAFMACKTFDPELRAAICNRSTPGRAKRMGRQVPLREDWEDVKVGVMQACIHQKFSRSEYCKKRLLWTGDQYLLEGNTWHDNFWGDCSCSSCSHIRGENMLGRILMEVREELLQQLLEQQKAAGILGEALASQMFLNLE